MARNARILDLDGLVKSRSDQLESDLGAVVLMRKGSGERPFYAFVQDNGNWKQKEDVLCPTFVAHLV